ncbi:MAG: AzlD domain-containing protein [Candidatus Atribacteria bacterium]|nr:AzlD domain-containing protein [Candidatus Atribacteria bacterium]
MNSQLLLILGMMFVTYIPRLLPFAMVLEKKLPSRLVKFLQFIPYAALGALIIPGVFSAIPEMPKISILGISFSFVYAWFKGGIIIPVLGSVLVVFLMLLMKNGFVL